MGGIMECWNKGTIVKSEEDYAIHIGDTAISKCLYVKLCYKD